MDRTLKKIMEPVPLETQGVCATCRFYVVDNGISFAKCSAVSEYATIARAGECNRGRLWEEKPAPIPLLRRLKLWLVG